MGKLLLGKGSFEFDFVEFEPHFDYDGSAGERQGQGLHEENIS